MELCFVQQRFLMPKSLSITLARWNHEYSKHTKIRRYNIYPSGSNECAESQTFSCRKRPAWLRPQHIRLFRNRPESLQTSRMQPEQMQSSRSQSVFRLTLESQPQTGKLESGYLDRNRSGVVQPRWNNPSSSSSPKNTPAVTSTEQRRNRRGDSQRKANPNAQQRLVTHLTTSNIGNIQSQTCIHRASNHPIQPQIRAGSVRHEQDSLLRSGSITPSDKIQHLESTDRLNGMGGCTLKGDKMLDEELVQLLQHGQREAFTTLVSKWQDRIYTFCYRQLGETALAEEATQDVFIKVYTSIHTFRKEAKFSTWLYRIATNHCINLNNRHHRRQRGQHQSFDEMHNQPAEQHTPLQQLEKRDFEQQLQEALHQLPEEHRVLLILRDIQDCSYEEIAEITQLNVGTIKSRIHRGRSNLRQILSGVNRHE